MKQMIFLILLLALVGCSGVATQDAASVPDSEIRVTSLGNLPSDVCMVDGRPLILAGSVSQNAYPNIVYIDKNGDVQFVGWDFEGKLISKYRLYSEEDLCR